MASSPGTQPSWSVVIVSNRRTTALVDAIAAVRQAGRSDVELVVVLGPDADWVGHELAPGGDIVLVRTPERNISAARNLGVRAARAPLVAFLDDDSVPEAWWLDRLDAVFDDPDVVVAGGPTLDGDGVTQGPGRHVVSRTGELRSWANRALDEICCSPQSWWIPFPIGANCAFRRSALVRAGGFDENFRYFLEEAEVCVRLVDRGGRVAHAPDAWVHHLLLSGGVRNAVGVVTDWSTILWSTVYYAHRHGAPRARIAADLADRMRAIRADVDFQVSAGRIDPGAVERLEVAWHDACISAVDAAGRAPRTRPPEWFDAIRRVPSADRRLLAPTAAGNGTRRTVVVVAPDGRRAIPDEVDPGCLVRLLTPATGAHTVSFDGELGIWVHEVPCTAATDRAMEHEIDRIRSLCPVDDVMRAGGG